MPDGDAGSNPFSGILSNILPSDVINGIANAFASTTPAANAAASSGPGNTSPGPTVKGSTLPFGGTAENPLFAAGSDATVGLPQKGDDNGMSAVNSVVGGMKDSLQRGASAKFDSVFQATGATIAEQSANLTAAMAQGKIAGQQGMAAALAQNQALLEKAKTDSQIAGNKALADAKTASAVAQEAVKVGAVGPAENDLLSKIAQTGSDVTNLITQKNQANDVSFFENPLSYLYNQVVKVPILTDRLANRAQDLKDLTSVASTQAAALDSGARGAAAVNSANTIQQAGLIAHSTLVGGIADAQDPLIKAAQVQLSSLQLATSQAGAIVSAADAAAGLPLKEQQAGWYGTMKQAQEMNLQDLDAQRGVRTLEIQQKLDELTRVNADAKATQQIASAGLASFGIKPLDINSVPKQQRDAIIHLGLVTTGGLAADPVTELHMMKTAGIPLNSLPAGQGLMANHITQLETSARDIARVTGVKKEDLDSFVSNQVYAKLKQERYDLSDENQNQFFSPPNLQTVLSQPWARNNPVLTSMAPMVLDKDGNRTTQNVPTRFQDVLGAASALVKEGKLKIDQAAGYVSDVARNTLADNDKAYGYRRFAIPANQDQYNVTLPRPGGAIFGDGADKYNMFSKADIMKYILQRQSADASNAIGNFSNK